MPRRLLTGSTAAAIPIPTRRLRGALLDLTLSTSAPELYYAFVEATAFATKAIIDHLEKNGVEIDRLVGIGGISQKSPFVMQMLADVMNREVIVAGCRQACAMGADALRFGDCRVLRLGG